MTHDLTPRQRDVPGFIQAPVEGGGMPPTLRQIADVSGCRSVRVE